MGYKGKHRDARPSGQVVRTIAFSVAVVLLALATGGYALYRHLEGNITAMDLGDLGDRPDAVANSGPRTPLNVLVLGSDSRRGQTDVLGSTPGLSDTTILLHLSADRQRAYGISIPRDLMVQRPECKGKNGETVPGGLGMWNAAYAYGGAACTIKQFEAMTNIRVDHVVVVDFNGFKDMVDALGGVPICVPKEIDDEIGRIHLPAGSYKVSGSQALDYVRVRHVISDNGDIGRMKRQQTFLASMVNEAVSAGTLVNPVKLWNFLNAATKSLAVDKGLAKLTKLVDLAQQVRNIGLDHVKFLTMPITTYEPDPNRLAAGDGARELWWRIRHDKPLTPAEVAGATSAADPTPGEGKHKKAGASPSPSASPSEDPEMVAEAEANGLCA